MKPELFLVTPELFLVKVVLYMVITNVVTELFCGEDKNYLYELGVYLYPSYF